MSYLEYKSQVNHESARILQSSKRHCSAVHCAYYSSVQLMMHYLLQMGLDSAAIDEEKKRMSPAGGRQLGTHECVIKLVSAHVNKKLGYDQKREFSTNINSLKAYRVDSDYKNEEITPRKGHESVELCDKINKFLKNML